MDLLVTVVVLNVIGAIFNLAILTDYTLNKIIGTANVLMLGALALHG